MTDQLSALAGEETPPLTPMSLATLLGRIEHEWATRKKIFDLPNARIWKPDANVDLSFEFLGRRAQPLSDRLRAPIVSWRRTLCVLARRFTLVRTQDGADTRRIGDPAAMYRHADIGYNIEWSQELLVHQSLTEYTKAVDDDRDSASMGAARGVHRPGSRSPCVRYVGWVTTLPDLIGQGRRLHARHERCNGRNRCATTRAHRAVGPVRRLRLQPAHLRHLTLSTFHGCPPEEIESITKYLIDDHDLDVIVKLNPTLLGYETVAGIVNDELGYTDVSVQEAAFAADLQFARGIELIEELNQYAKDRGRVFGIKLTNTLVVDNAKQWMPEETMYLSGPPLHVLASTLLQQLADALPGRLAIPGHDGDVMVSFSAGITKDNLADSIAMGVNPATVCSDLLKPGGYGRLAPMLKALTKEIADSGHTNLTTWKAARHAEAVDAGHDSWAARHVAFIRGEGIGDYHLAGNEKLPRVVDNDLEMFGCVACNFCVTVCPNDAFFSIKSLDGMEGRQQYLLFTELCNECGNCLTFCPEEGDPAMIKPRLYSNRDLFDGRSGQGFLLEDGRIIESRTDDGSAIHEGADLIQMLLDTEQGNPLYAAKSGVSESSVPSGSAITTTEASK